MKTAKQIAKELREKGLKVQAPSVERITYWINSGPSLNLYPVTREGRGSHSRYNDRRGEMMQILEALDIPYELSNKAPKGRLLGTVITIQTADLIKAIS
jgi:hypothetical protein